MAKTSVNKIRLSERINAFVNNEAALRGIAESWTRRAKNIFNEASRLTLERITIPLNRLPRRLDGLRIVHLSDIHHSPYTSLEMIERAVRAANRIRPDLIALTGDYVSHDEGYIEPVAKALGQLRAKFGVYACLGNHDHWTNAELIKNEFSNAGIKMLVNEGFRIEIGGGKFWLSGVDDQLVGKTDLEAALRGSFPDEMKLLLAHNPIIFRSAVRARVDLSLSGHTHGGQIRIRDSQNRFVRRRRRAGLHRRRNSWIYITRGIGTVVVPLRFQCPPEISVLELKCAAESSGSLPQ